MSEYYIPPTKKAVVEWIKNHYTQQGQTVSGLERKPYKQLIAIYHSIRKGLK